MLEPLAAPGSVDDAIQGHELRYDDLAQADLLVVVVCRAMVAGHPDGWG
jgi:hypothetical protein